MLSDERSRANFTKFGLGDPDEIISQRKDSFFNCVINIYSLLIFFTNSREKMLKPEDVAMSVWESVDKPPNVHVNDVLIRDAIQ